MSDEEKSSFEDDFSASEDEWKPSKSFRNATDDDSDDDDSDFEDGASTSKRASRAQVYKKQKSDSNSAQTKKRKSTGPSLRDKLFNKYKPPPKTVKNLASPSKPSNCNDPGNSQSRKHLLTKKKNRDSSDSESSVDDHLVNPEELDLQSTFFDVKPKAADNSEAPQFDCNAGMNLTDSDDDEDHEDNTESVKEDVSAYQESGGQNSDLVDLGYLQEYTKKMQNAEIQFKRHKERSLKANESQVDVSSLLAMGETGASTSNIGTKKVKILKKQIKKTQIKKAPDDSDSDWEEVEEAEAPDIEATTDGIQVCVDLPQNQRKKKNPTDMEASLKRYLNRIVKENQLRLHKISLLGHFANGIFLNNTANDTNIMPKALKLLPSKNAYPNGQTEIKYFQSMVTWYKTAVKVTDAQMFPKFKVDPSISIPLQIKNRHATCKRDFILIFVILLRAMGMQCRLVINMIPIPMKPDPSMLCSLKMKPPDDKEKLKEEIEKKPVQESLSPEEKEQLRKKMETLEKEIQKKKLDEIKPKPSFEDVLKAEVDSKILSKKEPTKRRSTEETANDRGKKIAKKVSKKSPSRVTESSKLIKKERAGSPFLSDLEELKKEDIVSPFFSSINCSKEMKEETSTSPFFSQGSEDFKLEQEDLANLVANKEEQIAQKPIRSRKRTTRTAVQNEVKSTDASADDLNSVVPSGVQQKKAKQPTRGRGKSATSLSGDQAPSSDNGAPTPEGDIKTKRNRKVNTAASATSTPKNNSQPTPSTSKLTATFTNNENMTTNPRQRPIRQRSCKTPIIQVELVKSTVASQSNGETNSADTVSKLKPNTSRKRSLKTTPSIPQLDGGDDVALKAKKKSKKKASNDSEDDFEPSPPKKPTPAVNLKKPSRPVISPDTVPSELSPGKSKKNGVNLWVEVYSELEAQWICIDLFKGKVNCIDTIRKSVTPSTLAYVFAFNNDGTMKDVTARYCAQWATTLRKHRIDPDWLEDIIKPYVAKRKSRLDREEDIDLRRMHLDKPLPTTIAEYKNHPLYALQRHLLKFEAIYPPNAVTLGFVRGEPVYARECVHTLHSREIWLKSARVVKLGEKPYKIVKARPKWDKFTNTVIKDQPLEIFGYWQTKQYDPPTAENGIVPRNAYGNVELFKKCMLPKKTVHLNLPGLNRICKKLNIDCAPAVVGFDFHQGMCHPLIEGFVICQEFEKTVVDAWDKDQEEAELKEQKKYEARVYGNWKKLIKGLLIRERLKLKYKF